MIIAANTHSRIVNLMSFGFYSFQLSGCLYKHTNKKVNKARKRDKFRTEKLLSEMSAVRTVRQRQQQNFFFLKMFIKIALVI